MAEQHVVDAERRGQHGEVGAHPLDGAHDRVHGVVGADLHARAGQQPGRQEGHVGDAVHAVGVLVDERAQRDPHGRQVEDGDEEAGGDRAAPGPLVLVGPVARPRAATWGSRMPTAPARPRRGGTAPSPRARPAPLTAVTGQSTRVRPVRRRNTSSRVERRTSVLSGHVAQAVRPRPARRRRRRCRGGCGRAAPPGARPARPASGATSSCCAGREAQLDHLLGGVRLDQLARRALGGEAPLVHDDQPVAELLGLVHVVGGDDQRDPVLLEPVEAVPEQVAGLGVEPGGRLVEDQQVGIGDERPGDGEPPLHAARQRVDPVVGPLGQLGELEQLLGPLPDHLLGQVEVAPVDHEVVEHRQLEVERVLLGDQAHAGPDARRRRWPGPCRGPAACRRSAG